MTLATAVQTKSIRSVTGDDWGVKRLIAILSIKFNANILTSVEIFVNIMILCTKEQLKKVYRISFLKEK